MHKVAIIICNYNYEDYVVGSIDSALSQIFYENEVILTILNKIHSESVDLGFRKIELRISCNFNIQYCVL